MFLFFLLIFPPDVLSVDMYVAILHPWSPTCGNMQVTKIITMNKWTRLLMMQFHKAVGMSDFLSSPVTFQKIQPWRKIQFPSKSNSCIF